MALDIQPATIDDLMKAVSEERALGQIYALRKRQGGGLFMDALSAPSWDQHALTVRMTISTEDPDRQGHVIIQKGITKDNYALNPIVLWDHGDEYAIPVATSMDKSGKLHVETDGVTTWAVAHHEASDKMSMQLFDAVVCGLLRASSIGVQPLHAGKAYHPDGSELLIVDASDMFEWSYTAVGVQPKAVLRSLRAIKNESFLEAWALQCDAAHAILARGTLDGRPILDPLRKAISSILTPAGNIALGHNPAEPLKDQKEKQMKTLTNLQIRKLSRTQLLKSLATPSEFDEATLKAMQEEALIKSEMEPENTPASGEAPPPEVVEEVTDETPLGAKVTAAAHDGLLQLIGQIESSMGPVENPSIKEALTEQVNMLRDCVTAFEGIYGSSYPELPGLAIEPEVTDEMVKSFLSQGRNNSVLAGLASRVGALAKSVTGKPQQALARTASELNRLHTLSKAYKPQQVPDKDLEGRVNTFVSRINDKLGEIVKLLDESPAKV